MSEAGGEAVTAVNFGEKFAESELFMKIFAEGMALVEETAAYLDGEGREESKTLGRPVALAYATESMRLTTRLMQLASWLLLQRAVAQGEVAPEEARKNANKIPLKPPSGLPDRPNYEDLPEKLRDLIGRTDVIYSRIYRIDRMLTQPEPQPAEGPNPVSEHMSRLEAAFGTGARK
jgi:regulator of CtrA degradation